MFNLNRMIMVTQREQANDRAKMLKAGKIPALQMTEREARTELASISEDSTAYLRVAELESALDGLK